MINPLRLYAFICLATTLGVAVFHLLAGAYEYAARKLRSRLSAGARYPQGILSSNSQGRGRL
jgi:hypothetical protein